MVFRSTVPMDTCSANFSHLSTTSELINMSVVPELISPNYLYSIPQRDLRGPEGFSEMINIWRTAFPDLIYTIDGILGEMINLQLESRLGALSRISFRIGSQTGSR